MTKGYCSIPELSVPSSTTGKNCEPATCSSGEVFSAHCKCSHPYTGTLRFRTPSFFDWGNDTSLQERLMHTFQFCNLPVDSVSLSIRDNYPSLEFTLQIFPSSRDYFSQGEILRISSALSNLTMDAFYFYPDEYEHYGMLVSILFSTWYPIFNVVDYFNAPFLSHSFCLLSFRRTYRVK